MKYVILSDIHGNVDALLAVVKEIAEKEKVIDNILIAGDIVGYGASPNECCDLVRFLMYGRKKLALENIRKIASAPYFDSSQKDTLLNALLLLEKKGIAIAGNHDKEAAGEPSLTSEMNPIAKTAVDWTNGVLRKENIKFLLRLPLRIKFSKDGFEIVHSKPLYPRGYDYVKNAGSLKYTTLRSKITFGGHTHRPSAYIYTKEIRTVSASVLIPAEVRVTAKTGVEMEAITAASVCAITIYDMCKSADKEMVISDIHLVKKSGGKSGTFVFGKNS